MLVCGGYGGVMEAASKGARGAGGTVSGVLPDSDKTLINPYVTIPIVTGMGRVRNLIIALTSDAVTRWMAVTARSRRSASRCSTGSPWRVSGSES